MSQRRLQHGSRGPVVRKRNAGPTGCPAALNIAGEHFDCDWPRYPHDGWGHSNQAAQAIWVDDRNEVPSPKHGMRPRKLRRLLALSAFGAILAGTGLGWGVGVAKASPETDYLAGLNAAGFVVYDTTAALATGYAICQAFNTVTGDIVAENLYANTTWTDVPTRDAAAAMVVIAGIALCPWHFHPERATAATQPGFVA